MNLRQETIARLQGLTTPDVVILGGGVNGIAILRDLALNGVSCVLIERSDFCQGASGASSRMAHGGLRYLENREFALVREALAERDLLLQHAPHAVVPQEFLLPVEHLVRGGLGAALNFLGLGKHAPRPSALGMKAALVLYDRFCSAARLPRHRMQLSRAGLPDNAQSRFKASLSYFDGKFINPETLVFEMLEEAIAENPDVTALNHAGWVSHDDGSLDVSGVGFDVRIKPRIVVNATGAWLDKTNAQLGVVTDYVTAVKGAQIILDHQELLARLDGRVAYFPDHQGRFVLCAPMGKSVLVGTSEVVVEDAGDQTITQAEADYLLHATNSLFDDIQVSHDDILTVTVGARPLQKVVGSNVTAAPRNHAVHKIKTPFGQPLLCLAGGKWTTFRPFAEETADAALALLGTPRKVSTRTRPYRGTFDKDGKQADSPQTQHLARRYGAVWAEVQAYCVQGADKALTHAPDYSRREIEWLTLARGARALDDLILRRTRMAIDQPISKELLREVAGIMAKALDQNAHWIDAEVVRVSALPTTKYSPNGCLAQEHGASIVAQ